MPLRKNPLRPSVQAPDGSFPLVALRLALLGKRKRSGKGPSPDDAATQVARVWSEGLPRDEQAGAERFYKTALLSWLTQRSGHTKRSYAGTVVAFFDFVARHRLGEGTESTLKLVAPHNLRQPDVDSFTAYLSAGTGRATPESITDPLERFVADWLHDALKDGRELKRDAIEQGLTAERKDWPKIPTQGPDPGFEAKREDMVSGVLSVLVRKHVLVRTPTDAEWQKTKKKGDQYPYEDALYRLPPSGPGATVSTQVQRLAALSSFWEHLLTDQKLGMSERPRQLQAINPWKVLRRTTAQGEASSAERRDLRKMHETDLQWILDRQRKKMTPKSRMGVRNVLYLRDLMATLFLVSTGLRVNEALQARVENLSNPQPTPADPEAHLWKLSGIVRKGRREAETMFVPRLVLQARNDLISAVGQYIIDAKQAAKDAREAPSDVPVNLAQQKFFTEQFEAWLKLGDTGPLIPALGRWGNAILKADVKAAPDTPLAADKLAARLLVGWDERSLRKRLLGLAKGDDLNRRKRLHPHAFRHLSVALAEANAPGVAFGVALAGHRDARTTNLYRDMVSIRQQAVLAIESRLVRMLSTPETMAQALQQELEAPPARPRQEELASTSVPVAEEPPTPPTVLPSPTVVPFPPKELRQVTTLAADLSRVGSIHEALTTVSLKPGDDRTLVSVLTTALAQLSRPGKGSKPGEIHAIGSLYPSQPLPKDKGLRGPSVEKGELFAAVKPETWFLPATSWELPVYVSSQEATSLLTKGYMPGPQTISQLGLAPSLQQTQVYTGIRTLLPYVVLTNVKLAQPRKWTAEEMLDATGAVKMLTKNAKGVRKISLSPERLVTLPVVRDSAASLTKLGPALTKMYDKLHAEDAAAARTALKWLTVMLQQSRRALAKTKDAAWLEADETAVDPGEDTMSAYDRTRPKTLREHEPREITSFLYEEGATWYGALGQSFEVKDAAVRDQQINQAVQDDLDGIAAVNDSAVGSFLVRYELPSWVTDTDDPLGDMPEADRRALKDWMLSLGNLWQKLVTFDAEVHTLQFTWKLLATFVTDPEATTITAPPGMADSIRDFMQRHQVEPVVACRRFVRHLWEARAGLSTSERAVQLLWGTLWSWTLPSSGQVKAALKEAGSPSTARDMARFLDKFTAVLTIESLTVQFEEEFVRFRDQIERLASQPGKAPGAQIDKAIQAFAQNVARDVWMGESNRADPGLAVDKVRDTANAVLASLASKSGVDPRQLSLGSQGLGTSIPPERFAKAARDAGPTAIALHALLASASHGAALIEELAAKDRPLDTVLAEEQRRGGSATSTVGSETRSRPTVTGGAVLEPGMGSAELDKFASLHPDRQEERFQQRLFELVEAGDPDVARALKDRKSPLTKAVGKFGQGEDKARLENLKAARAALKALGHGEEEPEAAPKSPPPTIGPFKRKKPAGEPPMKPNKGRLTPNLAPARTAGSTVGRRADTMSFHAPGLLLLRHVHLSLPLLALYLYAR